MPYSRPDIVYDPRWITLALSLVLFKTIICSASEGLQYWRYALLRQFADAPCAPQDRYKCCIDELAVKVVFGLVN